jgi:hypothetical protein
MDERNQMATKVRDHLDRAAGFHPSHVRAQLAEMDSFNAKLALVITKFVGSMWCAYLFALLAFCSLPAILSQFSALKGAFPSWLTSASLLALVAWVSSYFLQLVLLSVIMVGQDVQSQAADARSVETENNTKQLIDLLDINTQGGIADLKEHIDTLLAPPVKTPARRTTAAKKK